MKDMLAIIIPYFKLTFFRETLESLAAQTDQRFTVYIGDDASPEDPRDVLNEFEGKFNFVYRRFEENLGGISLTKQWERCIELIKEEEWLVILGDDDVFESNVVQEFNNHRKYLKNNYFSVRMTSKIINESSAIISKTYYHPTEETPEDFYGRKHFYLTRSSLSEHFFSRESYEKYKFFDYPLAWCSDDRAWFDFSNSKPIFTINSAVVRIRNSTINISGNNDTKKIKGTVQLSFYKYVMRNYGDTLKEKDKKQILFAIENLGFELSSAPRKNFSYLVKNYFIFCGPFETLMFFKRLVYRILQAIK